MSSPNNLRLKESAIFWVTPAFALLTLVAFCFLESVPYFSADPDALLSGHPSRIVHTSFNHVFSWRFDPLLSTAADLFFETGMLSAEQALGLTSLLVFLLGALYFNWALKRSVKSTEFVLVLLPLILVTALFGLELPLWASIAWLPWWFVTLLKLSRGEINPLHLLTFVFFYTLFVISAQSFQFPLVLLSVPFFFILYPLRRDRTPLLLLLSALIAFSYFSQLFLTAPNFPLYGETHVVPLSPTNTLIRPLVGESSPLLIPDIERASKALLPRVFVVFLVILSLLLGLRSNDASSSLPKKLLFSALMLCLFLTLESALIDPVLAPFQAFERIVSGLSFPYTRPLFVWMAGTLASAALFLALKNRGEAKFERSIHLSIPPLLIGILLLPFLSSVRISALNPEADNPLQEFENVFPLGNPYRSHVRQVLASPSYSIIREEGIGILHKREMVLNHSFHRLRANEIARWSDSVGTPSEKIASKFAGDLADRWSITHGKQLSGEWLELELVQPREVIALKLYLKTFETDFPRGVTVLGGESCQESDLEQLYSEETWIGSYRFTADGYPTLSGQSTVEMYLPQPTKITCLRFVQSGRSENYDWSVTGVGVFP